MSTPIYLQIGEGRRFRIGEFVDSGELSFADLLRAVAESVEPAPPALRWFRDHDGEYWRENPDGTLTLIHWARGVGYVDSDTYQGLDLERADEVWGPLVECEAPGVDDR